MLITEDYRRQQAALHAVGNYGTASLMYGETVAALLSEIGATSLLDYGCGSKRSLLQALRVPSGVVYEGYDPAVPDYASAPAPADLVCCIDVLEHIEPALLANVLEHLAELCDPFGFFTIHTGPAGKVLPDGRNAHLTQQPLEWWLPKLTPHFEIVNSSTIPSGFALLVRSRRSDNAKPVPGGLRLPSWRPTAAPILPAAGPSDGAPGSALLVMKLDGHRVTFPAPAGTGSDWACVFGLEHYVAGWLRGTVPGALLVDIGAGFGARTTWAAVARRCRVLSLEDDPLKRDFIARAVGLNDVATNVVVDSLSVSGATPHEVASCVHMVVDAANLGQVHSDVVETLVRAATNARLLVRTDDTIAWQRDLLARLMSAGFRYADAGPVDGLQSGWRALHRTRLNRNASIVLPGSARGRHVLDHVCKRVASAAVESDPFPYAVIDEILPREYYEEAVSQFPAPSQMRPIRETGRVARDAYPERYVTLFNAEDFTSLTESQRRFWTEFDEWMNSDLFLQAFVAKFQADLEPRLTKILATEKALLTRGDALLVNDHTKFKIGPHTDAPHRLVTFLFYMPKDESMKALGTSVYRPKDPNFVCWGGPHHASDNFRLVDTVEFMPNRLLTFPKTEKSFHGVEQISREGVVRPLVINNIRLLNKVTH